MLAHTFVDQPYNRTGFTLAAASPDKVRSARLATRRPVIWHLVSLDQPYTCTSYTLASASRTQGLLTWLCYNTLASFLPTFKGQANDHTRFRAASAFQGTVHPHALPPCTARRFSLHARYSTATSRGAFHLLPALLAYTHTSLRSGVPWQARAACHRPAVACAYAW